MKTLHIDEFSFGKIVVNGVPYNGDIKIVGASVVSSWWRRTGHRVDVTDIEDIVAHRPDVLVLGQGDTGLMKATGSLRRLLKTYGIDLIEERSSHAVHTFNRLSSEGKKVAAGFHVGC
jgi:hypothetical protein